VLDIRQPRVYSVIWTRTGFPLHRRRWPLGIHQIRRLGLPPLSGQRRAGRRDSALPRQMHYVHGRLIICGMSEHRHAKNAGAVFFLKHHIVWCPKYPPSCSDAAG
jgi:hypothetical protein